MSPQEFRSNEILYGEYLEQSEKPWFLALISVLEDLHPGRNVYAPPSKAGHANVQGFELCLQALKKVDTIPLELAKETEKPLTEEELATGSARL